MKATIKTIHKLDKPPFGDGIYTYIITTSAHPEGFVYAPVSSVESLKIKVGDEVEYEYIKQKNGYKYKDIKKVSMYSNYTKQEQTESRLDTGRSILLQVAFKEASQAYIAGKISQDEVESLTNKYFNIIDK
tara:strand:+ start:627 stop:1019 length:393 start_codon:yes stop_codon:yes gene_type:complete